MIRAIEQNKSPEEQNAEEMSDDEFIKYLLENSKVRAEESAKENEMRKKRMHEKNDDSSDKRTESPKDLQPKVPFSIE